MSAGLRRRQVCHGLLCACAPWPRSGADPAACPQPCLAAPRAGTFLQPLVGLRGLTADEWCRRLAYLPAFGARELVLQWLELDQVSFVAGDATVAGAESTAFLAPLLAAAADLGVQVHLGLTADTGFGAALQADPATLDGYLAKLRTASLATARAAFAQTAGSPAFAGWYLPEEIDDVNWREPARLHLLAAHLRELCRGLQEISGKPVSVSTYVTGATSPDRFGLSWLRILLEAPLTVLLQDGAGVSEQRWRGMDPYVEALRDVAASLDRPWAMVIELFVQQSGPPIDDQPFSARPAELARVSAQIEHARRLGAPRLLGFTIGDYLLAGPAGNPNALGSAYLSAFCEAAGRS